MSQINEKILELKEKLPYGAQKLISQRTGISNVSISRFFNLQNLHYETSQRILIEGFKILKEQKELLNTEI